MRKRVDILRGAVLAILECEFGVPFPPIVDAALVDQMVKELAWADSGRDEDFIKAAVAVGATLKETRELANNEP